MNQHNRCQTDRIERNDLPGFWVNSGISKSVTSSSPGSLSPASSSTNLFFFFSREGCVAFWTRSLERDRTARGLAPEELGERTELDEEDLEPDEEEDVEGDFDFDREVVLGVVVS